MHTVLAAAGVFLVAVSPIIVIGAVVRVLAWARSGRGRHRAQPTRPERARMSTDRRGRVRPGNGIDQPVEPIDATADGSDDVSNEQRD